MGTVDIRNVRKTFGPVEILHGVRVDIADGEFVVLVGPSGCGKSTLLRTLAGLENITSGEIAIGGKVVNRVSPKDRDIAMVFQNYALYPHITVFDNMAFLLTLAKAPRAVMEQEVGREPPQDPRPRAAPAPLPAPAVGRGRLTRKVKPSAPVARRDGSAPAARPRALASTVSRAARAESCPAAAAPSARDRRPGLVCRS